MPVQPKLRWRQKKCNYSYGHSKEDWEEMEREIGKDLESFSQKVEAELGAVENSLAMGKDYPEGRFWPF